jgi:hypothetical protein
MEAILNQLNIVYTYITYSSKTHFIIINGQFTPCLVSGFFHVSPTKVS